MSYKSYFICETKEKLVELVKDRDLIKETNLEIHCDSQLFYSNRRLEIDSKLNTVKENALWLSPVIELHNCNNHINKDLLMSGKKIILDHATIQAEHIYVLECAEIINDSSVLSCEIERISQDKMSEILSSYISAY